MINQQEIEEAICQNVKYYRKMLNLTQKNVAQTLNISLSSYQKLEQGQRTFSTAQLSAISKSFDIDISLFFSREVLELPQDLCTLEEKVIYKNLHKILMYLDVKKFTTKDTVALVNYLKKYGRSFLYTTPIISRYYKSRYEIQQYFESEIQQLKEYYLDNLPGLDKEIADLLKTRSSLIKEINELNNSVDESKKQLIDYKQLLEEVKGNYLKYKNEERIIQKEIAEDLKKEYKEKYAKYKDLVDIKECRFNYLKKEIEQLESQNQKLINIQQYFFNRETLSEENLSIFSEYVTAEIEKQIDDLVYENDELLDKLYSFEECGFDIREVDIEKIEITIQKKINEYIIKEYNNRSPEEVKFIIQLLYEYVKKFGMLSKHKKEYEKDYINEPTTKQIMDYYLQHVTTLLKIE